MSNFVRINGGLWLPQMPYPGYGGAAAQSSATTTVANDQEEIQFIGHVQLAGGAGSTKTFGTAGSGIGWLPGTVTFNAVSTLRVGVKKAATFSASGPPGRATVGSAAFDVYKDLVAGTDTITTATWNNTSMATGSSFTVAQGDKIAVCFYLNKTSGTSSIQVRGGSNANNNQNFPFNVLVTASGATVTAGSIIPNVRITFDDGTVGWIAGSQTFSIGNTVQSVSNGNIYGNVTQFPFNCMVDAVASIAATPSGDFTMGLWQTPAGTPTAMTNGTVAVTAANTGSTTNNRFLMVELPAEVQLTANTAYFPGFKPTTASGGNISTYDVDNVNDLQSMGLDSNTYAGLSTAGGAVAQQNSGKRRASMMVRISQIDIGSAGAGGYSRARTAYA